MLKARRFSLRMVCMILFAWPVSPARAQSTPEKQENPSPNPLLAESVGLLAGVQLYQTFLNIGLLADARSEGVYEDVDAGQMLGSVLLPLKKVDKQLDKLTALKGLPKDDLAALTRLKKISVLLIQQGDSLAAFWTTGERPHAEKYEASRQKAWVELEDLLDLKPKAVIQIGPEPRELPLKK